MIYFVKNIFNQTLTTIYDSRVQKYVGFGEFGIRNADHYNNKAWKMAIRKAGDYLPIQCKILQTEHFGKNR